jgi:hypothetical protein
MPPKKRKIEVVHFEHPYVTVGTSNIRGRKRGKQIADKDIRNNVLMFLENLKDEEAKNYSQSVFQGKLSSAVSGALDPVEGPEAYIGLSEYHPDFPKIFGNKAAGQLMGMLLGSLDLDHDGSVAELQQACDKMKTGLEREEKDRKRVENTLSWLQELIPVDDSPGSGKRTLSTELEALDQPVGDAAWLYAILWASCLRWMDSRLRQLHKFGAHNNTKLASQPGGMSDRLMMINARLHGGDLRTDALMCHISFGDHRQDDFHYDQYIKDCFKNAYNLSIHDGLWLGEC